MERRSNNNLHYILVVRRGLAVKVPNVDFYGKPAQVVKKLRDIYAAEDAKLSLPYKCMGSVVKRENQCLPVVDRTLLEIEPQNKKFSCRGDDVVGSESDDCEFVEMTLKQLKDRCKSKKRKHATPSSTSTSSKQANASPQSEEDDDLKVPLSYLKSVVSKKSKAKKRCTSRNLFAFPKKPVSIKLEEVLESDISMQLRSDFPQLAEPKAEIPEKFSMQENTDSANCSSDSCIVSESNSGTVTCCEIPIAVDCEEKTPVLFAEEQHLCTLNQISYEQFEYEEPESISSPSEEPAEIQNEEGPCKTENNKRESYAGSYTEVVATESGESPDLCDYSRRSSDLDNISCQSKNNDGFDVPEATIINSTTYVVLHNVDNVCTTGDGVKEVLLPNQKECSVTGPVNKCISSWNLQNCSGSDNILTSSDKIDDKAQPTEYCFADAASSCLISGNSLDDEKQPPISPSVSEESEDRNLMFGSPSGNVVGQISTSQLSQHPERLFSTRKAISPSSQERLCLSMNSVKLIDDLENYKCKEKLTFGEQTEDPKVARIADGTTNNSEGSPQLNRVKVFIGPKQIGRRLKSEKRSSPPKGNLEGPRLSRSLPQLSTGCTSIKHCSDSAIAFSQRQMHDIESLATKLMNELKSMKDMVEEKMLFEAYRSSSLKSDADEVKVAIKSATKVEETTRKWLSMMTRDCTRFCKIMKLSQNDVTASKSSAHREGRKISFADEAGGMLCNVNYFEDRESTLESDSAKQEDMIIER